MDIIKFKDTILANEISRLKNIEQSMKLLIKKDDKYERLQLKELSKYIIELQKERDPLFEQITSGKI